MSLYAKAQAAAAQVQVKEEDRLGGSFTVPTDVYLGGVKMAYIDAWKSGALFIGLELAMLVEGKERTHKEIITISNKEGAFTYTDKKTGDAVPMPGYVMIDGLFKAASGKGFLEQSPTVKGVKMYCSDAKAEVVKEREVFMDVIGKRVHLAITEQEVDKTAKDPVSGDYKPTGETRKENVLSKVFDGETKQTTGEKAAGKPAEFCAKWVEQYQGKCSNRAKGNKAGSDAQAGAPATGAVAGAGSLFGA